MQTLSKIDCGQKITLSYPTRTTVGGKVFRFKKRHFLIESVRDLTKEPLTPIDILRRPLNRRSRFLLQVIDLKKERPRRIYLGNSAELQAAGTLRVGLYEPGICIPQVTLPRRFGNSAAERRILARLLQEWSTWDLDGLQIGIFAEDFKLVG